MAVGQERVICDRGRAHGADVHRPDTDTREWMAKSMDALLVRIRLQTYIVSSTAHVPTLGVSLSSTAD